ncbi:cation:proton antiporter domain-containing protein [Micromonospora siamensis]|uniref:Sodium/proton antiporter, CPA1 family n=1 Tax=Micromonospora siamensis TaxID=299152 RepID=A0A1C5I6W4_9ACTN|nr:cation:proton antiporter [Micromonospora siamensis]SCG54020.1 sodium/proton antiporter, CPA1 family [Micromonospora siamensis]
MTEFALYVTVLGAVAVLAVLSNRLADRLRLPAPALFLFAAAILSDVFPSLNQLSLYAVRHLVELALVLVLFSGGMSMGWRRLRPSLGPVALVGVLGTLLTAGLLAVALHWLFGFDWLAALLVGTALSPTDPAAVFSVLGRRTVVGRSGTVIEGESGANDPVGIALMVSLLAAGTAGGWSAVASGAGEFALQLAVGTAVGLAGGWLIRQLMRRVVLPDESLYPLQVLFAAGAIYGVATLARGSGFLAVFLAGILVGDAKAPFAREIRRFHGALASLGEILAFSLLGLVVSLRSMVTERAWLTGLGLALLLTFVIRPLVVGGLLTTVRLRWGERIFIVWSGLKGAVPILLGTFILTADLEQDLRLFDIIFAVVAFSIVVQGGLVPLVARWCRVPMRTLPLQPWAVGLRVRGEPVGLRQYTVSAGAPADGRPLFELSRDEGVWVSLVSRGGEHVRLDRDTVLRAGDDVLVAGGEQPAAKRVFTGTTD